MPGRAAGVTGGGRAGRARALLAGAGVAVAAVTVVVTGLLVAARPADPPPVDCPRVVGAWLPHWRQGPALASFVEHAGAVRELTPFWYELVPGPGGDPVVHPHPGAGDRAVVAAARRAGVPLIPIVTNFGLPRDAFAAVLADPARRSALVVRLRALAATGGYAGLDLDFEDLGPDSRTDLTALAGRAATALHADGRLLVLSVPAKTEEPGRFTNTRAFDYPALGRAADLLRLMTYGLAAAAPIGPVAPLPWTDAVAAFAARVVDPAKVQLGLPLGGYDWPAAGRPRSITFGTAEALRLRAGAARWWDAATGSAYFRYGGRTVWYADAESVRVRAAAVTRHRLAGVALWSLGDEDPAVWRALPGCG